MTVVFVSTVFMKRKAVAHFQWFTIQQNLSVFQVTKATVRGVFLSFFFLTQQNIWGSLIREKRI